MQVDIVTPERRLLSMVAHEIQIPGAEGDLTAMDGHASAMVGLRPGILRAKDGATEKAYVVTGGFAEINAASVTVLAEQAIPVEEATSAVMDKLLADMSEAAAINPNRDEADKAFADMAAVKSQLAGH
jgi:F-type H+-transporting ATPase subunit epsilon